MKKNNNTEEDNWEAGIAKPIPDETIISKPKYRKTHPDWVIDAEVGLTEEQTEEAFQLLERGLKSRKVAFRFGFHRKHIRPILKKY